MTASGWYRGEYTGSNCRTPANIHLYYFSSFVKIMRQHRARPAILQIAPRPTRKEHYFCAQYNRPIGVLRYLISLEVVGIIPRSTTKFLLLWKVFDTRVGTPTFLKVSVYFIFCLTKIFVISSIFSIQRPVFIFFRIDMVLILRLCVEKGIFVFNTWYKHKNIYFGTIRRLIQNGYCQAVDEGFQFEYIMQIFFFSKRMKRHNLFYS